MEPHFYTKHADEEVEVVQEEIQNPEMFSYNVEDINVTLPVNPYICQKKMMTMVVQSIKESKNCILDSPTGSGKTLAILCGGLAWQLHEKKLNLEVKFKPSFKRTAQEMNSANELSTEGLVSIHKKHRRNSTNNENVPNNTLKPQDNPTVYVAKNNEIPLEKDSTPTIYYGVKTHSQLQHVINEFKKTPYYQKVRMSLLSSRNKSCIREFNKNEWKSVNDMCRSCVNECVYYHNRHKLNHSTMPPVFDLEELAQVGKNKLACPYYGAKEMAKTSDIIFCTHDYLLDPNIRSKMQIKLEDAVVILDDGHNIEQKCRDVASLSLSQVDTQKAFKELEDFLDASHDTSSSIDWLILYLKKWDNWFKNQLSVVQKTDDNIYNFSSKSLNATLKNYNIGYDTFDKYKDNYKNFCLNKHFFDFSSRTSTLLETLVTVLSYFFKDNCKYLDDFKPVLVQCRATDRLTLHLHCMTSAIVMENLHDTRCIILSSGTLMPGTLKLKHLETELHTKFNKVYTLPDHNIPDDRMWISAVSGDIDGPYYNIDAPRLGKLIKHVSQLTPGGVLCFIPSFDLLEHFKIEWSNTGLWSEIIELKEVFCEERDSNDHNSMIKKFQASVVTKKGALLFAVYRGKVAEGLDSKDEKARAVIWVGIPNPSIANGAVYGKKDYNKRNMLRGLLSGSDWFDVQTFRAVNQAAGRCIRHNRDWGAILLVDERYQEYRNAQYLSNWMRKRVLLDQNKHTYETMIPSLDQFITKMKAINK